jgi:hypothetical protein
MDTLEAAKAINVESQQTGRAIYQVAESKGITSAAALALAKAMAEGKIGSDFQANLLLMDYECPKCCLEYIPCAKCATLPKGERRQKCLVCPECGFHAPSQLEPSR